METVLSARERETARLDAGELVFARATGALAARVTHDEAGAVLVSAGRCRRFTLGRLHRAVTYAGGRRVSADLWEIPDHETTRKTKATSRRAASSSDELVVDARVPRVVAVLPRVAPKRSSAALAGDVYLYPDGRRLIVRAATAKGVVVRDCSGARLLNADRWDRLFRELHFETRDAVLGDAYRGISCVVA